MTETVKTLLFVAAAAVALVAAFVGSAPTEFNVAEVVGENLTEEFDVEAPKRLEITTFDQETAARRDFEVAEEDGVWRIPSKQGYPADATEQMAQATAGLGGLEVLRVASMDAGQHEEFGVVDPSAPGLTTNSEGVGVHVTMTDANDNELVDLVIGNEVKDSQGQRYVRRAKQDIVFVVELDPEKLSTDFNDWIERDLLQLSPLDVREVQIDDYSFDVQPVLTDKGIGLTRNWDRRGRYQFVYHEDGAKWEAAKLQRYDPATEQYVPFELAEDEEVNQDALRDLRTALDDLKIVDVERKPAGLSGDLKAGEEFIKSEEAAQNLFDKGFTPQRSADGSLEVISSEGETLAVTREGVKYTLRFGTIKVQTEAGASEPPVESEADAESSDGEGLHRYLFVTTEFDESAIKRPELEELPDLPEDSEPADGEPASADVNGDAAPTDDASDEDASDEDAPHVEPATATETSTGGENVAQESENVEQEGVDEEGVEEEEQEEEVEPEDGEDASVASNPSEATGAAGEEANEPESDPAAPAATDEDASEEDSAASAIIARRKAIEQENQRKLDEYEQTVESGKKKVKQLNERFGDWYYLIDNEVYKNIHLSRDDVIKTVDDETEDGANGADAPATGGLSGLPQLPIQGPEESQDAAAEEPAVDQPNDASPAETSDDE